MIQYRFAACVAVIATFTVCANAQNAAVIDNFKKAFNKRMQSMKIEGFTERNVLFQNVRLAGGNAGSYQFEVTALIRDYGPGYPKNRYYGETCVGKMNQRPFTFGPDGKGGWGIDGRFTVGMGPDQQCKKNPGDGASSFPLASLSGTPAPDGPITPPGGAAVPAGGGGRGQGGVAPGSYECWANGQARMLLNFTISGGARYTDSEGKAGGYSFDSATARIVFKGGMLDGLMPKGFYSMYHEPKGRPTVSFRNSGGSEVTFCEKVR